MNNSNNNNNNNSTEFRIPFYINTSLCLKYVRQARVFLSIFRCFLCSVFVMYAEAKVDKKEIKTLVAV